LASHLKLSLLGVGSFYAAGLLEQTIRFYISATPLDDSETCFISKCYPLLLREIYKAGCTHGWDL
jgi:hypothetical protein